MRIREWPIHFFFGSVAVVSGLIVSVVGGRGNMAGDGISYLDMGDALVNGHWRLALNGFWSPLFPLIEGLSLRVFHPPPLRETIVVVLTQFMIFILALLCFQFFWRRVLRLYGEKCTITSSDGSCAGFSEGAFWALGYTIFIYSALPLLDFTTPDLLLTALLSLAEGMVLEIYLGKRGWPWFMALGGTVGLGFLAKAVILPLSITFLAAAALVPPIDRRAFSRVALVAVAFLLIIFPYIWALSAVQGHVTYGSAGRLNYAWHVNNVPNVYALGPPRGSVALVHPTRLLLASPAVYEFAYPIEGTYPPWDNPAYWNEGLEPHFLLRNQIRTLLRNIITLLTICLSQSSLLAGVAILMVARRHLREMVREFALMWYLWLPGAAAIALYVTIHVEPRYISPFWGLLWAPLICLVRLPDRKEVRRFLKAASIVSVTIMMIQTGLPIIPDALSGQRGAAQEVAIARGLMDAGIRPGDKIAVIDDFGNEWQRLIHVSVIVEILDANSFWASDAARQAQVYELLAAHGAAALVAGTFPNATSLVGWRRIGTTSVYIRSLKK
jgi:hypothetical protein